MSVRHNGLRLVATLEASKGFLALVVGLGIHALAGEGTLQFAEHLVSHLHLNPASHYPGVFISAAGSVTNAQLSLVAIGAGAYSLLRFIEAYGLWRGLRWTEWFALLSGAIYIPFETYEIFSHVSVLSLGTFSVNILVVAYMAYVLFGSTQKK